MESPWVKLSDRAPTDTDCPTGRVLVHFKKEHDEIIYSKYSFDDWGCRSTNFDFDYITDNVDYWMPIPAIPNL